MLVPIPVLVVEVEELRSLLSMKRFRRFSQLHPMRGSSSPAVTMPFVPPALGFVFPRK